MRPDEKTTPLLWRALQATCLVVILVSFVSTFRAYRGPQLSVSHLTRRPGSSVVVFSNRIEEGDRLLVESFRSVDTVLKGRNVSGEVDAARDSVERGIRTVTSAPGIDDQSDKYRSRLLELLTRQQSILTEFTEPTSKNRTSLRQAEDALIAEHNQFVSDYGEWWPGFLKEHGYRPASDDQ
jgi:hypothetical protein